ncbi:MAG: hypothetical protein IH586_15045, partial [Anaerolineaceae bacterium]|nr:hypothetical protein [Anaerolineaceae bacterium]
DYDNDGDQDILITGYQTGGSGFGAIYRNDAGVFNKDTSVAVPAVGDSNVIWGDYDADKDLDFVIQGKFCETCTTRIAQVLQNNGSGYFWPINLVNTGLWNGAAVWIDVDKDGDLDLILSGNKGPDSFNRDPVTLLFKYSYSTGLTETPGTNLPGLWQTSIAAGDYDNDRYPDLLINGLDTIGHLTRLYTNDNGVFTDANLSLASATGASVAWGQLDGDGNMDFVVTGVENTSGVMSTYLYKNVPTISNTVPAAPTITSACWDGNSKVIIDWSDSSDAQTPSPALIYSLRIGTSAGSGDISNPPAAISGYRRLSIPDGSSTKSYMFLKAPPDGVYHWAVQAVDTSFTGSPFSGEGTFLVGTAIAYNDAAWVAPSGPTLIQVLNNDNTKYGSLIIQSVQDPPHGWAAVHGSNISYTPDPGWSGTETFEYFALSPDTGYCSRGIVTAYTPGVYLNAQWVKEEQPVGTEVGTFSTTNPNAAETFTYSLASGEGSQDNGSFTIQQNKLLTAAVFNYSVKQSLSIR